jgi:hypothetical protein
MSASPGAYLTSLQTGIWYKIADNQWMLPIFINATITANTSYGPYVTPKPQQSITSFILTVTAVSGTSPTLSIGWTGLDIVAVMNGIYEGSSSFSGAIFTNVSSTGTYSTTYTNSFFGGVFSINTAVGGTSPSFTVTLTMYTMA